MLCTTAVFINGLLGSTGWSQRQGTSPRRDPRGMCQLTVLGWQPCSAGAGFPWQQFQARAGIPACIQQQRADRDHPVTVLLRSIAWCVTRHGLHGSELAKLHPLCRGGDSKDLSQHSAHVILSAPLQDCCDFRWGVQILQPCRQQANSTVRAALASAHSLWLLRACQAYGDALNRRLAITVHFRAS